MVKIVEGYAARLKVPAGTRDVLVFDDDLAGFGIRKFVSGKASYFVKFQIGAQQRRHTLGAVARGNLKDMRVEASKVLAKARLGIDAVAEARVAKAKARRVTLGQVVAKYLTARESEFRLRSYSEVKRHLERDWKPLHGRSIDEITRADVVLVLEDIANRGKVAADRACTSLSTLYAWAIDRSICEATPVLHIKSRAQKKSRTRVLSEPELMEIWKACGDEDYGRIIRLLILTGQRKSEIGGLIWSELDFDNEQISLPGERTKNKLPHLVPLTDESLMLLPARREGRDLVFGSGTGGFSGWSKAKSELDARMLAARQIRSREVEPMEAWVVHDLRRSVATHLNERGFAQPHVVEAIMNHVSGHKRSVAGIYNKALYLNERQRTLVAWGQHVARLAEGCAPKVVVFPRTA